MCVQRLSVGAAAFLLLVLGMSSAWAQVGTAISHLSHKGPVWSSDQTPSKLGWGGDDKAYPDRFAVNPKDGAEMVWVPAGSFRMGSNEGQENEKPVHSVRLGGFWIYRHEVTNAQFDEFAKATGVAHKEWQQYAAGRAKHPAVHVVCRLRKRTASGPAYGCPRKRSGSTRPAAPRTTGIRGARNGTAGSCAGGGTRARTRT